MYSTEYDFGYLFTFSFLSPLYVSECASEDADLVTVENYPKMKQTLLKGCHNYTLYICMILLMDVSLHPIL
jgi:hypothetical protein